MLAVEFPGHPKAYAIIADESVSGMSGIAQCSTCGKCVVLATLDAEAIADEIEGFIKNHKCLALSREEEVVAFAERLKEGMPKASIRVKKGRKTIREF